MLKPKSTISEMKNLLSIWNLQKKGSVNWRESTDIVQSEEQREKLIFLISKQSVSDCGATPSSLTDG